MQEKIRRVILNFTWETYRNTELNAVYLNTFSLDTFLFCFGLFCCWFLLFCLGGGLGLLIWYGFFPPEAYAVN